MNLVFLERLKEANLTGETLTSIFTHLETIIHESKSGQAALTLGYLSTSDVLQDGDLIPTINIVLTQYNKEADN